MLLPHAHPLRAPQTRPTAGGTCALWMPAAAAAACGACCQWRLSLRRPCGCLGSARSTCCGAAASWLCTLIPRKQVGNWRADWVSGTHQAARAALPAGRLGPAPLQLVRRVPESPLCLRRLHPGAHRPCQRWCHRAGHTLHLLLWPHAGRARGKPLPLPSLPLLAALPLPLLQRLTQQPTHPLAGPCPLLTHTHARSRRPALAACMWRWWRAARCSRLPLCCWRRRARRRSLPASPGTGQWWRRRRPPR